ncbi:MAG: gamma-glutamyltransferase [Deltaproteobacteria bacterium]|jgi:gamma-glutamyltranspeptidase/glutathione hydrolase|nr:gamma-glutamyltransferase [Deltaproteobacteria bacterium]MBW2533786.1 gamma-glutamyltransferase [Deltaproteobacteria bacterium]
MRGVVAAGSLVTAEAGGLILERGGNAADAAVGACFASAVGEPTLTSLAGGGILIYRSADTGETTICDFFSDVPRGFPANVADVDFFHVDLDFGPVTQRFYIGRGTSGVPGVIPGLCQVLERWGTLSVAEAIEPACAMLRQGRPLGPYQGRAVRLLAPIVTYHPKAQEIFLRDGALVDTGDHFALPQLADTLEQMAREGWRDYYRRVLWPAMLAQFGPEQSGVLTAEDLEAYQVYFRKPLQLGYRGGTVMTNPPPSAGGPMIGLMLRLLDREDLRAAGRGSKLHLRRLCQAMQVADEARADGSLAVEGPGLERWARRMAELGDEPLGRGAVASGGPPQTTHVSVIDRWGNAAGVTFSYGEGNGHIIADTGIMMNNLMGEEDLFPDGFGKPPAPPGQRLPSMMSPTIVEGADGSVTVIGTGGANRIRTAIVQAVSYLTDFGLTPHDAARAPRLHFEGGVLNAEVFGWKRGSAVLEGLGAAELIAFDEPNLFFGGVHMVRRLPDGTVEGGGDPRRGGACKYV